MAGIDRHSMWRWLIAAAVLAAFLGAASMNMERLQGWSFITLCFVASLLGGVGYLWARDRVLPSWERLPKVRRLLLVVLTAAVVLAGRLIANRHKPNEQFADVIAGIGVLVALALLGLYRIASHIRDSSHTRASSTLAGTTTKGEKL
jgi:drug/metabolite transporter (DMT)-like permease